MTDAEWYARRGATHAHCPLDCGESPQPTLQPDGRLLCMRCLVLYGVESECIPCVPETCPEAKG